MCRPLFFICTKSHHPGGAVQQVLGLKVTSFADNERVEAWGGLGNLSLQAPQAVLIPSPAASRGEHRLSEFVLNSTLHLTHWL